MPGPTVDTSCAMTVWLDPRPRCPGWSRVPPRDRPPELTGRPEHLMGCGQRRAMIVARRGSRTVPAWRLLCRCCGRYWWSRHAGAAAYPSAVVARALGWEDAAAAALAGFQGRRPSYSERPYYPPGEPRGGRA
jgi:hypothetical protein